MAAPTSEEDPCQEPPPLDGDGLLSAVRAALRREAAVGSTAQAGALLSGEVESVGFPMGVRPPRAPAVLPLVALQRREDAAGRRRWMVTLLTRHDGEAVSVVPLSIAEGREAALRAFVAAALERLATLDDCERHSIYYALAMVALTAQQRWVAAVRALLHAVRLWTSPRLLYERLHCGMHAELLRTLATWVVGVLRRDCVWASSGDYRQQVYSAVFVEVADAAAANMCSAELYAALKAAAAATGLWEPALGKMTYFMHTADDIAVRMREAAVRELRAAGEPYTEEDVLALCAELLRPLVHEAGTVESL